MNNNELQDFEFLDIITILGFIIQLRNMKQGSEERDYIHSIIKAIASEIQLLHKENDLIVEQLTRIEEKINAANR